MHFLNIITDKSIQIRIFTFVYALSLTGKYTNKQKRLFTDEVMLTN
jgi:hypothetical protein